MTPPAGTGGSEVGWAWSRRPGAPPFPERRSGERVPWHLVTAVSAPAQRRSRSLWSSVRHLGAFGLVGGTAFVIEVVLFQLLYSEAGLGAVVAKGLATVVAMTVAFFGHRHWSFAHRARTGFRREYPLFLSINGFTLLVGLGIVGFARYGLDMTSAWALQGANLVSIGVGTVLRYLMYRRWVFPAEQPAS